MSERLGFFATVKADLESYAEFNELALQTPLNYLYVIMYPGVMAVFLFRLSSTFHRIGLRPISRILYILTIMLFGADLPPAAEVGPGLVIPHPVGMGFASGVKIGKNVRLFQGAIIGGAGYEDRSLDGFPTIGDGAVLFTRSQVVGPVEVGNDAIIGLNAVVTKSIPAGAIAAGSPARVVRYRKGYGPDGPINEEPEPPAAASCG